jgi:hypothetical protein
MILRVPSSTCRRMAKSGTHTSPTPCSAKETKASTVLSVRPRSPRGFDHG